jgi:hypothetical protein
MESGIKRHYRPVNPPEMQSQYSPQKHVAGPEIPALIRDR